MALGSNDIALKVGFDIDRFTSELSKTNGLINKWSGQVQGLLRSAFSIYAVERFVESGIKSLAQFERAMSEVKAITGATGKEFQDLRDNALNLAGAFKAIDIAKLETEFGRLGFSTQEILESTRATISLASATGSDLATSAQIAGSTLRAFNLDAKEMNRVVDVMAGALNRTGLDMSNFAESIKYVAPNAAAANISIEETAALLGVLADNGIKGSMAGTTLRRIIQDLAKDGRPLNERLRELAGRGLDASDAMEEVGRIGSTGLLILTKNIGRIDDLSKSLHNVTGEAEAMSKVMRDNLIGDWQNLNAEWDKIINKNGGAVNGFFRDVLQNMKNQLTVWGSDEISIFEKVFGGAGDYARFAKIVEDAQKKLADAKAMDAGYFDASTGEWIGGGGGEAYKPQTKIPTTVAPNPYSHANALAASGGIGMEGNYNPFGASKNLFGASGMIPEYTTNVVALGDAFAKATKHINELGKAAGWNQTVTNMKLIQERQEIMDKIWARTGEGIGNAIGNLIQGTMDFQDALAAAAFSAVQSLKAIAVGYVIANAAKLGPFGVFAAGVGIGVVESLFAGLAGGQKSAPSFNSNSNYRGNSDMTFRIQGRDLVYLYDQEKGLDRSRTGG